MFVFRDLSHIRSAFGGRKTELNKRSARPFAGCWLEGESKTQDGGFVVVQPLVQEPGNYATLQVTSVRRSSPLLHTAVTLELLFTTVVNNFFLSFLRLLILLKIHAIMYQRIDSRNKIKQQAIFVISITHTLRELLSKLNFYATRRAAAVSPLFLLPSIFHHPKFFCRRLWHSAF